MGSRVFPAGVNDYDTNKEVSKNQSRRESRGLRRQYTRRRWRKIKLLEFLEKHGLTPFTSSDLNKWKSQRDQPVFKHVLDWFQLNPYILRKKGLDNPLSPHELGRVIYHMVQRRGFLSNRKDKEKPDSNDEKTIHEGRKESGTLGINSTKKGISEFRTLGEYLASIDTKVERIRNRYTTRQMYVDEIQSILETQVPYHQNIDAAFVNDLIGSRTKKNMDGILFFQRPLKSQKHTLGKCVFEPGKTRCPVAALEFEEFRVWQWINGVEHLGEKLSQSQKERLADHLLDYESRKFKLLKKPIGIPDRDDRFNYKDDDNIAGGGVTAGFRKAFGKATWEKMSDELKEAIWLDVYSATDNEWLIKRLTGYALTEKDINTILKIRIKRDYASLSKKAIRNILPFLKMGYVYNEAVLLGGIRNAFGEQWEEIEDKQVIYDTVTGFRKTADSVTIIQQIKQYLSEVFGLTEKQLSKLYHHSQIDHSSELLERLPEPVKVRNPIVMQALYEVRKLVNALMDTYGKFDEIHVELARELKKSKDDRGKIKKQQRQNRDLNERMVKILREYNQPISYDSILKLKLFDELRDPKCCPYTGKMIHLGSSNGNGLSLFSGQVQIEHIIPYSRSLNNSFGNLTLCDADENRSKGNFTPHEFYSSKGRWNEVKERAKDVLPVFKYRHFIKSDIEDDVNVMAARLLQDTQYMSREVHRYLKMVCSQVVVVTGTLTAELRHQWGLNSILSEDDKKNRTDHRHHAIDALVVALTDRSTVIRVSKWNKFNREDGLRSIPAPWDDLRFQAETAISSVLVSHKKTNRVVTRKVTKTKKDGKIYRNSGTSARGALHKDTIFGKKASPEPPFETAYHFRKSLQNGFEKVKQIEKIVDPAIRRLMLECVQELGVNPDKIPAGTFVFSSEDGKLHSKIHIVTRSGERIPVFKVRVRENLENAVELVDGKGQYVNPRNNHHVAIYEDQDGNLREDCVTFWDVVERTQQGQPIIAPTGGDGSKLTATLQANDMFLIGWDGDLDVVSDVPYERLSSCLYRVQKLSSKDYWFRHHTDSGTDDKEGNFIRIQSLKSFSKHNPIKVWVSPDGNIMHYQ